MFAVPLPDVLYLYYCMNEAFSESAIEAIAGCCFAGSNKVKLLHKGKESFTAIFDAVRNARRFVCLHFYIFRNDETGIELSEILKKKVREGVRAYIIYDHFGSIGTPVGFWRELEAAGVEIKASRPFKWTTPFHYAHRDHRKLIIIDGVKAFTGGLNIANEYSGFHLKIRAGWRDTGIILEGPIVSLLFGTFQRAWKIWGGETIAYETTQYLPGPESGEFMSVIPIFASSAKGRRRMRKLLYYSISNSRDEILLTTAYFTPSKRMIDSLERAIERGVKIKLLLPGMSDVPAVYYTARAFYARLLKAGVRIFNYQGEVLHAKSYLFDGCWSIVGSANLDFQSLRWNDEGNVGILSEKFGKEMREVFEVDLEHSVEIKEEDWLKRRLAEKIKERFFVLFRRRL